MFTVNQNKRQKSQLTHALLSKDKCVSDLLNKYYKFHLFSEHVMYDKH